MHAIAPVRLHPPIHRPPARRSRPGLLPALACARLAALLCVLLCVLLAGALPAAVQAKLSPPQRDAQVRAVLANWASELARYAGDEPAVGADELAQQALVEMPGWQFNPQQIDDGVAAAAHEPRALDAAFLAAARKAGLAPARTEAVRRALAEGLRTLQPVLELLPVALVHDDRGAPVELARSVRAAQALDPSLPDEDAYAAARVQGRAAASRFALTARFAYAYRTALFAQLVAFERPCPIAFVDALPPSLHARWLPFQPVRLGVQAGPNQWRSTWRLPVQADADGRFSVQFTLLRQRGGVPLGPMIFERGPSIEAATVSADGSTLTLGGKLPGVLFFGHRPPGTLDDAPSTGRLIHLVAAATPADRALARLPVVLAADPFQGVAPPPGTPGGTVYNLEQIHLVPPLQRTPAATGAALAGTWKSRGATLSITAADGRTGFEYRGVASRIEGRIEAAPAGGSGALHGRFHNPARRREELVPALGLDADDDGRVDVLLWGHAPFWRAGP